MDPSLLIIPLAGIALIIIVVWLTGGLRSARMTSEAEARKAIALRYPEFSPNHIWLAADGETALGLDQPPTALAVALSHGQTINAHLYGPGEVAALTPTEAGLRLKIAGLGAGPYDIRLNQTPEADVWRDRLQSFVAANILAARE